MCILCTGTCIWFELVVSSVATRVPVGCSVHDLILIGLRGCLATRLSDFSEPCSVRSCGSCACSVECWNVKWIYRISRWEFDMCWAWWSADRKFLDERSLRWCRAQWSKADILISYDDDDTKYAVNVYFFANLLHCAHFILILWNCRKWVWD